MTRMIHQRMGRQLIGCLLFFLAACHAPSENGTATAVAFYQRVDSAAGLVHSGDLIFRNGTDAVSRAARNMNRTDTSFSHCGILLVEHDSVFVYHAIGGEYNPSQQLRRDPLDSFLVPGDVDRFAIYRYPLGASQLDSLRQIVGRYYARHLRFDMFFNFNTDDVMYCSEFVFKSLNQALSDSLSPELRGRAGLLAVCPDDLFLNPRSQLIKRVDFTR